MRRVETANNRVHIRRNKKVKGGGFREENILLVSPPPLPDNLMRSYLEVQRKLEF